jgi:hypothetical protein
MTDKRELLELAARAAGIVILRSRLDDPMARDMLAANSARNPHHESGPWNPLTDDGDCARLEASRQIDVYWYEDKVIAVVPNRATAAEDYADHNNDRQAARRLASTRAAAEVARSMK